MKSIALSQRRDNYWHATRHPWVCVVFVLPLLLAYELGMHLAAGTGAEPQRNGADVWLRDLVSALGLAAWIAAPALILGILLAWGIWRRQRLPYDLIGAGVGMALESILFAFGLFGLSQALLPLVGFLQNTGLATAVNGTSEALSSGLDPTCQQILRYLGAGLYEETLFRLVLFSGLWGLFLYWEMPGGMAFLLAAFGAALCFAAAHHLGPHGEPFHALVFLFRTLAGGYFTALFCFRGFGIAVGAHAAYDVLVGVLLPG